MIYSDADILTALEMGTIIIDPFKSGQLGTSSYDICLGNTFYEVFWDNEGPYFIGPYIYSNNEKVNIPIGGTLLGVTKEIIGTSGKVVAEMRSRSSIRRVGIDPCMAAGWGDIGYNNRWVMEFTALVSVTGCDYIDKMNLPFLHVGDTVGQMIFHECKSEPIKEYDGQYQVEWPLNMIPEKYRHRVFAPLQDY
jgi:deoxycytidine triphosphate deaminase